MQIVYLSKRPEILSETIGYVENLIRFITKVVVVCPENLLKEFKVQTSLKIMLFSDETLLDRKKYAGKIRDHQMRNWLLRASLADHPAIDDEFIMADDDSRPLCNIPLTYFKDGGKYNSFYFYGMENWFKRESAYDVGQHDTCEVLKKRDYGTLSFSSHMPQIINKAFLREAVKAFEKLGTEKSIDEWSIYFNFCLREFPAYFRKPKIFNTLCWPALPSDWSYGYRPEGFHFENFYPALYRKNMLFDGIPTEFDDIRHLEYTIEKIRRRMDLQSGYDQMKSLLDLSCDFSQTLDLFYDEIHFKRNNDHFVIRNLPRVIFAKANSTVDVDIQLETRGKSFDINDLRGRKAVRLSFHWLDQQGICFNFGWRRYLLPEFLMNNQKAEMVLRIPLRNRAPGFYVIALDMVRGNRTWFDAEKFSFKVLLYIYEGHVKSKI